MNPSYRPLVNQLLGDPMLPTPKASTSQQAAHHDVLINAQLRQQEKRLDAMVVLHHAMQVRGMLAAGERLRVLQSHGSADLTPVLMALLSRFELSMADGIKLDRALDQMLSSDAYSIALFLIAAAHARQPQAMQSAPPPNGAAVEVMHCAPGATQ